MEPTLPGLKLIITKGPKSGETFEFKPGSLIRIGRVKRGNAFSISEDGISTKHLSIDSKSGKWTLQDLNSSNGTILNSTDLTPDTPVDLHDGDTVKIGEETAILVKFVVEEEPTVRRNPRRVATARATRSQLKDEGVVEKIKVEVEEDAAAKEEKKAIVTRKGRGRKRNLPELAPESGQVDVEVACGGDVEEKTKCEEEVKEKASQLTRKGRGRRRNLPELPPESRQLEVEVASVVDVEETTCEEEVEEEASQLMPKGRGRRRNLPKMPLQNDHIEVEGDPCGNRVTRNGRGRRKNVAKLPQNSSPVRVENNENLRSEEVGGVSCGEKEDDDCLQVRVGSGVEEKGLNSEKMTQVAEQVCIGVKDEVSSGVKESGLRVEERVGSGVEEKGPDLEKMTLGEWFNYMKVYLPKLITKETEEMIEEMKRKAERVHEYMKQQRREKCKV